MNEETDNQSTINETSASKPAENDLLFGDKCMLNHGFAKKRVLQLVIVILVTSVIRAIAMNVFAVPNKLSLGGVSGISSVLYNALGWNVALMNLVLNVPLLILAFLYINKTFALTTLAATLITSIAIEFLDFFPVFTDDIFVAALMSGILTGIAVGLLLKVNCSSGGTDIVGLLIQNKAPDAKVTWIFFIINSAIGVITGVVFKSVSLVIYSLICVFATSYATDILQRGFISTYEVKIITSKPAEIGGYIINTIHRGATLISARGMFTGEEHPYIICIVRKRQLYALKHAIDTIDPHAFYYITNVHDTIGKGFDNTVAPKSKIK
jgi:Uncharacterized conserved protein